MIDVLPGNFRPGWSSGRAAALHRGRPANVGLCGLPLAAIAMEIGAVMGSPSSSVPVSTIRTVKVFPNRDDAVALLAHRKPGVLDAAAQFPVRQEGDHRIGRTFLGGDWSGGVPVSTTLAEMIDKPAHQGTCAVGDEDPQWCSSPSCSRRSIVVSAFVVSSP